MLDNAPLKRRKPNSLLGTRRRGLLVLACGIILSATVARPASAQEDSEASAPPHAPDSAPSLAISPSQINAFAELLGEPVPDVAERLIRDPGLVPLAAAAAAARLGRRNSGKWMMAGGFSLHGLGAAMILYALYDYLGQQPFYCDDYCPSTPMSSKDKTISVVGLVAVGLGLAIAIPGLVRMVRQTDIETEAASRYQPAESDTPSIYPPASSHSLPAESGGKTLRLSLFAFSLLTPSAMWAPQKASHLQAQPSVGAVPRNFLPSPAPVPVRRPKLAITASEVETFADLLDETEETVEQRLRHDPGLVPLAVAAADARRARQRTGRNMMMTGFTLAGLSVTVGALMSVSLAPSEPIPAPAGRDTSGVSARVFPCSAVRNGG